ncbi:MAG: lytic murein transglycosylase B [Burkholderiales bacterium]|nr:lytic murein transglycosylase B [Burkholderiales bacterium]
MRRRAALRALAGLLLGAASAAALAGQDLSTRADVQAFIVEMVDRHGFVRKELDTLFGRARLDPDVLRLIAPPPPAERSWQGYRANFVNERRIAAGVEFWAENAAVLARAEARYGVPAEVIVGIIGIETAFGRNTGGFRVMDALATLAFDYPQRADFFRSELEQFLLFAREGGFDVLGVKGSYAGAIGIPQFMPGSYRRFAVDFDGDGRRDLLGSAADAIGSVGNFLREHGWERGAPAAFPARVRDDSFRAFIDGGVKPRHPAAELRAAGVGFDATVPDDARTVLVELPSPDAPTEYRVGLQNFYVLTRYNRSSFYASAVLDLAGAIRGSR